MRSRRRCFAFLRARGSSPRRSPPRRDAEEHPNRSQNVFAHESLHAQRAVAWPARRCRVTYRPSKQTTTANSRAFDHRRGDDHRRADRTGRFRLACHRLDRAAADPADARCAAHDHQTGADRPGQVRRPGTIQKPEAAVGLHRMRVGGRCVLRHRRRNHHQDHAGADQRQRRFRRKLLHRWNHPYLLPTDGGGRRIVLPSPLSLVTRSPHAAGMAVFQLSVCRRSRCARAPIDRRLTHGRATHHAPVRDRARAPRDAR